MQGHLYFIMGVSGSGKGTLRTNLKNHGIENLEFLKSYVTREMRPGEVDGDTYWFISNKEFEAAIEKWEFLEYELVHKVAYYGTKKWEIDTWLEAGKILMTEIDTKWLKQVLEKHPDFREHFTSFFLNVSNEEMERRYLERHPDGCTNDIKNRLESATLEREQAEKYCNHIIDATQSPEDVLQEVLNIMKK